MNTNTTHNATNDDEISLKDLILKLQEWWRYLLSKWLIILIAGLIGGVFGFLYSITKKPLYTASTTFVLEEGGGGGGSLGQYAGLAAMAGIDLGGGGEGIFKGDNLLELYKSRSMIQKTLLSEIELAGKRELIIDRYIEINQIREKWAYKPELKNLRFNNLKSYTHLAPDNAIPEINTSQLASRLQDSIINVIVKDINKNYLTVSKPDKKLSIIQAIVKSEDEIFAKSFNEQIVKNVNDFYVQTRTKKSLDNVAILQRQADSVKAVMEGAIYSSASALDGTPNLNPTKQVLRTGVQRSQFSVETNKAILTELIKNLEMSKMTLLKETPLIQVIDGPVFPLEKQEWSKIRTSLIGVFIGSILIIFFLLFRKFLFYISNLK